MNIYLYFNYYFSSNKFKNLGRLVCLFFEFFALCLMVFSLFMGKENSFIFTEGKIYFTNFSFALALYFVSYFYEEKVLA